MQLHPRTSTPKASTVLRDFLNQAKCICCTLRVVELTKHRAVVEWGTVPYFTARGRRADFVYYTAERVADIRPEVLRTWKGHNEPAEWVRDRLRDSWLVEQLVYWVEYLEEWKFYRECNPASLAIKGCEVKMSQDIVGPARNQVPSFPEDPRLPLLPCPTTI
ncbi:hypothetical protein EsH8_VIII_000911 [Colletotrichum jinshuiense]